MRSNASYTLPLVVNFVLIGNISCKSSADNGDGPSSSSSLGAVLAVPLNQATNLRRAYVQQLSKLTSALILFSRASSPKGQTVPSGSTVLPKHCVPDRREAGTSRTQVDPCMKRSEAKDHGVVSLWGSIGRPNPVPAGKISVGKQNHRSTTWAECQDGQDGSRLKPVNSAWAPLERRQYVVGRSPESLPISGRVSPVSRRSGAGSERSRTGSSAG